MKIDTMDAQRASTCSIRVLLGFGLITRVREIQRLTHLMAAEILGTISPNTCELANYQGTVGVDPPVFERDGKMWSSITMEAMDEYDLERAGAVLGVVHDVTELLV